MPEREKRQPPSMYWLPWLTYEIYVRCPAGRSSRTTLGCARARYYMCLQIGPHGFEFVASRMDLRVVYCFHPTRMEAPSAAAAIQPNKHTHRGLVQAYNACFSSLYREEMTCGHTSSAPTRIRPLLRSTYKPTTCVCGTGQLKAGCRRAGVPCRNVQAGMNVRHLEPRAVAPRTRARPELVATRP